MRRPAGDILRPQAGLTFVAGVERLVAELALASDADDEQTLDQMVENAGIVGFAGAQSPVRFQQLGGPVGDARFQRLVGALKFGGPFGDARLKLVHHAANLHLGAAAFQDLQFERAVGLPKLRRARQGQRWGISGHRTTAVTTEMAAVKALMAPWAT
jgi:hypothetical protein